MAKIFILFINFIVLVKIQENGISCVSLYTNILRNEYVCFDHMVKDSRGKWYNLCNWCHGLSPSEYYLYLLHNNVLIRRRRLCIRIVFDEWLRLFVLRFHRYLQMEINLLSKYQMVVMVLFCCCKMERKDE